MKSFFVAALALLRGSATATPLDDYVWAPDAHYKWENSGLTIHGRNADGSVTYTGYLLNLTSQQWLTPEDCSRSVWWHQLVVLVPSNLNPDFKRNATMWITGGGNENPGNWPQPTDEDIATSAALAMGTGTVTAALFQIPNEHIVFASDPIQKSRSEDAIIAFTWDHFLKDPSDPTWLVRFPMVKGSLRAMDAVAEFLQTLPDMTDYTAEFFAVSGASKRGWTTWLVGAVDPNRVVAIVPIVLDALNFIQFAHHQFKSYNGWSFALSDYYEMNITSRFDEPNMVTLSEYEDPYYYMDRLTMPTLVVNAVGDEFQQPDDTHYWWAALPEPKHFLMVPNAEHSLATGILEAVPAIGTWIKHLLDARAVPTFAWAINNATGAITVTGLPADASAVTVRKYWTQSWAGTPRRDFRFLNLDDPCESKIVSDGTCFNTKVLWQFEDLAPSADGSYVATHPTPTDGTYAAFFVDVTYSKDPATGEAYANPKDYFPDFIPRDAPGKLEFTTEVSVVPDTFPFEDCSGVDCYGALV